MARSWPGFVALPEPLDSETPLFILYPAVRLASPRESSTPRPATTCMPKTTGGCSICATTTCTGAGDIGTITGHPIVYSPGCQGHGVLIRGRGLASRVVGDDRTHKINILYTAPGHPHVHQVGRFPPGKTRSVSLRCWAPSGRINPEAWMWYHKKIGAERCPIVDTWWQTETGGIMMTPLPGATPTKPGSCCKPLPGIVPEVVGEDGKPVPTGSGGWLTITQPWPGMLRGIWGDDERYKAQYWSDVPGKYLCGDNARCDEDGYYWIMGRIDDVLNVSGHRLSTIEIESALVSHDAVAEAAAVGKPRHQGEAVAVFVTLGVGFDPSDDLRKSSEGPRAQEIGGLAVPDDIRFTSSLPRPAAVNHARLLRDIAAGQCGRRHDHAGRLQRVGATTARRGLRCTTGPHGSCTVRRCDSPCLRCIIRAFSLTLPALPPLRVLLPPIECRRPIHLS